VQFGRYVPTFWWNLLLSSSRKKTSSTLKIEAAGSFETLAAIYQTTQYLIPPKTAIFNIHSFENLKCHTQCMKTKSYIEKLIH
jgi:hypothetical protein